jgi:hypothetical protein
LPAVGEEAAGHVPVCMLIRMTPDCVGEQFADLGEQDRGVDRFVVQRVAAGEGEQAAADRRARSTALLDPGGLAGDVIAVLRTPLDARHAAADDLQEVVDVVRDAAGQLPKGRSSARQWAACACASSRAATSRRTRPSASRLSTNSNALQLMLADQHRGVAGQHGGDAQVGRRRFLQQGDERPAHHQRHVGHRRQRHRGEHERAAAHHPGREAGHEDLHLDGRAHEPGGRHHRPERPEHGAVEDRPTDARREAGRRCGGPLPSRLRRWSTASASSASVQTRCSGLSVAVAARTARSTAALRQLAVMTTG